MSEKEAVARLNLYDLILLLLKWYKLFVVNFLLVALASVIIVLLLPVKYSATTIILPPSGGGGGLPSFLSSDLKGVAANFGLETPSDNIYQTILSSRTLRENIIKKFDLRSVYDMDEDALPEDVIEAFNAAMNVVVRDDDAIAITVEDKTPQMAADIANGCVVELDEIYRNITSESARKNRIYIEKQLDTVNDSLEVLQDSLIAFQKRTNTISVTEQTNAMIAAAAEIKAQQIAAEVELEVMKSNFGDNHPSVNQLRTTSRELGNKYHRILTGEEGELFLSLQKLPEISRDFAELYRKVRVQMTLIEYIYPQYQSAKILEERETANVKVLDVARVPNKKSKPAKRLIVMISCAASVIFTLVLVLLIEYWNNLPQKNPEDWNKVKQILKPAKHRG